MYTCNVDGASGPASTVTLTRVLVARHTRHVSGKPQNFSDEQIQALRIAFREWHKRKDAEAKIVGRSWSQAQTGKAIGVSQQVAGKLLSHAVAGLSFPTAKAIAALEGFTSVEDFFAAHEPSRVNAAAERGNRDLAVIVGRRMGLADAAIDTVLGRYASSQFDGRPTKWWVEKFISEDNDLDDRGGSSSPPPPTPKVKATETFVPARTKKTG